MNWIYILLHINVCVSMCISRWPFKRSFVRVYLAAIDVSLFIALHTLTTWPRSLLPLSYLSLDSPYILPFFIIIIALNVLFSLASFVFYSSAVYYTTQTGVYKLRFILHDFSHTTHFFELTLSLLCNPSLLLTFVIFFWCPGCCIMKTSGCYRSEFCIF